MRIEESWDAHFVLSCRTGNGAISIECLTHLRIPGGERSLANVTCRLSVTPVLTGRDIHRCAICTTAIPVAHSSQHHSTNIYLLPLGPGQFPAASLATRLPGILPPSAIPTYHVQQRSFYIDHFGT
jgi:hypothetical protein